ncbi:hypothetical protein LZ318_31575 [Saccharopolyspora indica]|uniref:hypothetical protein n=1 Tax=Saccharopolyspora indica TaxID=1229659 RepID=UPI0022EB01AD|nr:hypothetical protein [Saccharopolyspora indica]MDA3644224.1 hypothetical protein [Saccharopolyspora indica]
MRGSAHTTSPGAERYARTADCVLHGFFRDQGLNAAAEIRCPALPVQSMLHREVDLELERRARPNGSPRRDALSHRSPKTGSRPAGDFGQVDDGNMISSSSLTPAEHERATAEFDSTPPNPRFAISQLERRGPRAIVTATRADDPRRESK